MSDNDLVRIYLERLAARLSAEDFRQVVGRLSDEDLRRRARNEMESLALYQQSQREGKTEEERKAIFTRLMKERKAKYNATKSTDSPANTSTPTSATSSKRELRQAAFKILLDAARLRKKM